MSLKEKLQVVAISVATALAVAGAIWELGGSGSRLSGDDDAPILIAGGSLYFGTHPDFRLAKINNTDLQFADASYNPVGDRVFLQIDVQDSDDMPHPFTTLSGATKVTVAYCKGACSSNEDDITLQYDPGTHHMTITNTLSGHPIARVTRVLPNLLVHERRKDWAIDHVDVYPDGTTKNSITKCDNGECSIVVHTCGLTGHCTVR